MLHVFYGGLCEMFWEVHDLWDAGRLPPWLVFGKDGSFFEDLTYLRHLYGYVALGPHWVKICSHCCTFFAEECVGNILGDL